jgi:hypothetical protein
MLWTRHDMNGFEPWPSISDAQEKQSLFAAPQQPRVFRCDHTIARHGGQWLLLGSPFAPPAVDDPNMLRPVLAFALVATLAGCAKDSAPLQQAYTPPPVAEAPPAPWCAKPAELTAFSVAALKSNLMVTAISCRADDKYNAFVTRYRPALVQQEKVTDGYFNRNDRRRWETTRDDYITRLANAQSQRATVLGSLYCQYNLGQFDEVLALQRPDQIGEFAATRSDRLPQAMKFSECPAGSEPAPAAAPASRKTRKK